MEKPKEFAKSCSRDKSKFYILETLFYRASTILQIPWVSPCSHCAVTVQSLCSHCAVTVQWPCRRYKKRRTGVSVYAKLYQTTAKGCDFDLRFALVVPCPCQSLFFFAHARRLGRDNKIHCGRRANYSGIHLLHRGVTAWALEPNGPA